MNRFRKKINRRSSTGFWIRFWILLPRNFIYTFREGSFAKKKIGRIKEWIFSSVRWNIAKQTIVFTKKTLNIISLDEKIKRLKFFISRLLKEVKVSCVNLFIPSFTLSARNIFQENTPVYLNSKISWARYL